MEAAYSSKTFVTWSDNRVGNSRYGTQYIDNVSGQIWMKNRANYIQENMIFFEVW